MALIDVRPTLQNGLALKHLAEDAAVRAVSYLDCSCEGVKLTRHPKDQSQACTSSKSEVVQEGGTSA